MRKISVVAVIAAVVYAGAALASYVIRDGSNMLQTVFSFVCSSNICGANAIIDSSGTEKATPGNPLVTKQFRSTLGYCQLTNVSSSTAVSSCTGSYGSGVPVGSTGAVIDFEYAYVRETSDGFTAPTANIGMRHKPGDVVVYTSLPLDNIRVIQETPGAQVNVTFLQ